jgi:hypothetical protein
MQPAINSCIAIALLIVATCPLSGCLTAAPGYETTDFHANGTPVASEEKAEQQRRHQQECRRLYLLLGDRSLTPAQIDAVRVARNANFCFNEGP